jgi:hypothetical protein
MPLEDERPITDNNSRYNNINLDQQYSRGGKSFGEEENNSTAEGNNAAYTFFFNNKNAAITQH